jgi:hypothetical protein
LKIIIRIRSTKKKLTFSGLVRDVRKNKLLKGEGKHVKKAKKKAIFALEIFLITQYNDNVIRVLKNGPNHFIVAISSTPRECIINRI